MAALLDFLKRKKEVEKAKKPAESAEEPSAPQKPEKQSKPAGSSSDAVKTPHISEKSTNLGQDNQYVFKVSASANKLEIARSIEKRYKVSVRSVNVITIPKKKRRLGKIEGFKKGYKKAIVTIKKGQKIEVF